MTQEADFQRIQREFCAHLRDPRHVAPPEGIEDRRMAIYRRLFFNNIYGLIERMFPHTTDVVGAETLRETCYEFYSHYACRTPYFHQIDTEFASYLAQESPATLRDFPYAAELADYECTRRHINLAEDTPPSDTPVVPEQDDDLFERCLVLCPLMQLRVYEWPVHQITEALSEPRKPEVPTPLLLFRNRKGSVQVIDLDLPSARLLLGLQSQPEYSARDHLDAMLNESDRTPRPAVVDGARNMLATLHRQGAILGLSETRC